MGIALAGKPPTRPAPGARPFRSPARPGRRAPGRHDAAFLRLAFAAAGGSGARRQPGRTVWWRCWWKTSPRAAGSTRSAATSWRTSGTRSRRPVGALALLAEAAVETAEEDREQLLRFLARIRHEAARLSKLVTELIDLSRVQGAEARPDPASVAVDAVLAEAVDRISSAAEAKGDRGRRRRRLRGRGARQRIAADHRRRQSARKRDCLQPGRHQGRAGDAQAKRVLGNHRDRPGHRDSAGGSRPGLRALLPGGSRPALAKPVAPGSASPSSNTSSTTMEDTCGCGAHQAQGRHSPLSCRPRARRRCDPGAGRRGRGIVLGRAVLPAA